MNATVPGLRDRWAGELGAEAFCVSPKSGVGAGGVGRMMGEPCAGLVSCWGGGGDLRNPRPRMLGMSPLGGTEALPAQEGKAEGVGACAPGWGGVSREPPPPGLSACDGVWTGPPWQSCWESGHRPCGWQARWLAFPPSTQVPTRAPSEPRQHRTRGPPTGLHSAGTREPETSDHSVVSRGPTGLRELSPAQPAPQDDTRIGTLVSCRRRQLPSASAPSCGQGWMGRWVSSQAPWASDIIFWGRGGRRRCSVLWRVWGLQEGRRARGDLGMALRPKGRVSRWRCLPEAPALGSPGLIFQSVEKYCMKSLRGGAGPRPGGRPEGSGAGPPNASLLG